MENTEFIGTPIDGKDLANKITEELKEIIRKEDLAPNLKSNMLPSKMQLIIVTTGDSAAGMSYVKSKVNKCKNLVFTQL